MQQENQQEISSNSDSDDSQQPETHQEDIYENTSRKQNQTQNQESTSQQESYTLYQKNELQNKEQNEQWSQQDQNNQEETQNMKYQQKQLYLKQIQQELEREYQKEKQEQQQQGQEDIQQENNNQYISYQQRKEYQSGNDLDNNSVNKNRNQFQEQQSQQISQIEQDKNNKQLQEILENAGKSNFEYENLSFNEKFQIKLFEIQNQQKKKLTNKSVITFFGVTGSGKSTTICSIFGVAKLVKKKYKSGHIYDVQCFDNEVAKVASSTTKSETLFLQTIDTPETFKKVEKLKNMYLLDMPGTMENRGFEVEISNQFMISSALQQCKKVKPILVFGAQEFTNIKMESVKYTLKIICSMIDVKENLNNISVFITQEYKFKHQWDALKYYERYFSDLLYNFQEKYQKDQLKEDLNVIEFLKFFVQNYESSPPFFVYINNDKNPDNIRSHLSKICDNLIENPQESIKSSVISYENKQKFQAYSNMTSQKIENLMKQISIENFNLIDDIQKDLNQLAEYLPSQKFLKEAYVKNNVFVKTTLNDKINKGENILTNLQQIDVTCNIRDSDQLSLNTILEDLQKFDDSLLKINDLENTAGKINLKVKDISSVIIDKNIQGLLKQKEEEDEDDFQTACFQLEKLKSFGKWQSNLIEDYNKGFKIMQDYLCVYKEKCKKLLMGIFQNEMILPEQITQVKNEISELQKKFEKMIKLQNKIKSCLQPGGEVDSSIYSSEKIVKQTDDSQQITQFEQQIKQHYNSINYGAQLFEDLQQQLDKNQKKVKDQLSKLSETFKQLYQQGEQSKILEQNQENNQEENKEQFKFDSQEQNREVNENELDRISEISQKTYLTYKTYTFSDRCFNLIQYFSTNQYFQQNFKQQENHNKNQEDIVIIITDLIKYIQTQIDVEDDYIFTVLRDLRGELFILKQLLNLINLKLLDKEELRQQYEQLKQKIYNNVSKIGKSLKKIIQKFTTEDENLICKKLDLNKFFSKFSCLKSLIWIDELLGDTKKEVENIIRKARESFNSFTQQIFENHIEIQEDFMQDIKTENDVKKQKQLYQNIQNLLDLKKNLRKNKKVKQSLLNNQEETQQLQKSIDEVLQKIEEQFDKKIKELQENIEKKKIDVEKVELNVQVLLQYKQVTENFKGFEQSIGFKKRIEQFFEWLKEFYNKKLINQIQEQIDNIQLDSYPENYVEKLGQSQISMSESQLEQSKIINQYDYNVLFKKWKHILLKLIKIQNNCPYIKLQIFEGQDLGTQTQELIENELLDKIYENFYDNNIYKNEGENKYKYKKYLYGIQQKFQKIFEKHMSEIRFQQVEDPEIQINQNMNDIQKEISDLHSFDQNNQIFEDSQLVKKIKIIKNNEKQLFDKCFKTAEDKLKFLIDQNLGQKFSLQYWQKNSNQIFMQLIKLQPFIKLFNLFGKSQNIEKLLNEIQEKLQNEFTNISNQINQNVQQLDIYQGYKIALDFIQIISKFNEENIDSLFKQNIKEYTDNEDFIYNNYIKSLETLKIHIQNENKIQENMLQENNYKKIFQDINKLFQLPDLKIQIQNKLYEFQSVCIKKNVQDMIDKFQDIKNCNIKDSTFKKRQNDIEEEIMFLEKLNITKEDKSYLLEQLDQFQEDIQAFQKNLTSIYINLSNNFINLEEQEIFKKFKQLNKTQKKELCDYLKRNLNSQLQFFKDFDLSHDCYQDSGLLSKNISKYQQLLEKILIIINEQNWQLQQKDEFEQSFNMIIQQLNSILELNLNNIQNQDFTHTNELQILIKYVPQIYTVLVQQNIIKNEEYNNYISQKIKIEKQVVEYLQQLWEDFQKMEKLENSFLQIKSNFEKKQKIQDLIILYKEVLSTNPDDIHEDLQQQLNNYKDLEQNKQVILKKYKECMDNIEFQISQQNIEQIQQYINKIKNINVLQSFYDDNSEEQYMFSNEQIKEVIIKYQKQKYQNFIEFIENKNIGQNLELQYNQLVKTEQIMSNNLDIFKDCEQYFQSINIKLYSFIKSQFQVVYEGVTQIKQDIEIFNNIQEGSMDQILRKIIDFYKISTLIFSNNITHQIVNQVEDLLNLIKNKMETDYFLQLGQRMIQLDQQFGQQIVKNLSIFMEINIKKFQQQTISLDPQYIIEKFQLYNLNLNDFNLSRNKLQQFSDEQKQKLLSIYEKYMNVYNDTLDSFYSLDINQKVTIDNIKFQILEKMNFIKQLQQQVQNQFQSDVNQNEESEKEIGYIIGKIFVLWSILDKQKYTKNFNDIKQKRSFRQPHSVQVFSILIMLNLHNKLDESKAWYKQVLIQNSFQNQIIEILTGQGKSITLGIIALIFALLGYNIKVACYSKYLSQRDYQDFKNLFEFLEIQEGQIFYGTYIQIFDQHLNKNGNIREIGESFFSNKEKYNQIIENYKNKNKENNNIINNRQTILLIDEIDQFFSKQIYGSSQNPVFALKSEYLYEIFDYIWQNRDTNINAQQIYSLPQYEKLIEQYQTIENIIQKHINQMIKCAKEIEIHYNLFQPQVVNGVIGYKQFDSINIQQHYGYATVFCYFKENQNNPNLISLETVKEKCCLLFYLGKFSYAQSILDLKFENILGVTGTLFDLDVKIFKYFTEYNFQLLNFAPSIYPERNDIFKESKDIKVCNEKVQWHSNIHATTVQAQKEGQPTIIFFKNINELVGYKQFLQISNKYDPNCYQELVQNQESNYSQIINRSTMKKQVTLADSIFGRGVDYQCYDSSINKIGGLLIIIAFVSKQKVEEKQIMGRTGRNGQSGEIKFILLQKQLTDNFKINEKEIQIWTNKDTLYQSINEKRNQILSEKLQKQVDSVKNLESIHEKSYDLLNAFLENNEDIILEIINNFNK